MADKITVFGGQFFIKLFTATEESHEQTNNPRLFVSMDLRFAPRKDLQATQIHLIQTVKDTMGPGEVSAGAQRNVGFTTLRIPGGEHEGLGIDMEFQGPMDLHMNKVITARKSWLEAHASDSEALAKQAETDRSMWALKPRFGTTPKPNTGIVTSLDPAYAQQRISAEVPPYTGVSDEQTTGWACVRGDSGWAPVTGLPSRAVACLRDQPGDSTRGVQRMDFEVAALAVDETGPVRFVGSVRWGWDRSTREIRYGLELGDFDHATEGFFAAAAYFNDHVAPSIAAQANVPVDGRLLLPVARTDHQLEVETPVWGLPRARHGRWVRRGRMIIIEDD